MSKCFYLVILFPLAVDKDFLLFSDKISFHSKSVSRELIPSLQSSGAIISVCSSLSYDVSLLS